MDMNNDSRDAKSDKVVAIGTGAFLGFALGIAVLGLFGGEIELYAFYFPLIGLVIGGITGSLVYSYYNNPQSIIATFIGGTIGSGVGLFLAILIVVNNSLMLEERFSPAFNYGIIPLGFAFIGFILGWALGIVGHFITS